MIKRVLPVLLIICILAGTVNASSATVEMTVAEGSIGDVIDVTVSISGNPGLAYFKFTLDFDTKAYTPLSIRDGAAIPTGIMSNLHIPGADTPNYVTAQWFDASDFTADGELFTVSFLVNDISIIPFNLSYNSSDMINQNLEIVPITIVGNSIDTPPEVPVEVPDNGDSQTEVPDDDSQSEEPETPQQPDDSSPETPNYPSTGSPSTGTPSSGSTDPSQPEDSETLESENDLLFSDIGGYEWASDAITALASKGIIKGTGENTFSPAENTRRADYMLLTVRLLGLENDFTDNFDDVAPDAYYYREIGIAKAAGLTSGTGENKFSPDGLITRQDMFVIAHRIFNQQGFDEIADISVLDQFDDSADISDYAREALAVLVKSGWVKGNDNRIEPQSYATRAEMAVFLYRVYEWIG